MKAIFLILLSSFIIGSAYSQYSSSSYRSNWNYYNAKYHFFSEGIVNLALLGQQDVDPALKIKTLKSYKYKKGVKYEYTKHTTTTQFDNGELTNYKRWAKGKLAEEYIYEYNSDGYYTQFIHVKNNKTLENEVLTYNDSNKVSLFIYTKKEKPKEKRVYAYNDNFINTRRDIYYKDHLNPDRSWTSEYSKDGKIIKREYYKKGILKSQWLYTCDEEGEKVDLKKTETKLVCSITQNNNDGSYVRIFRTTDGKGKVSKNRWTYNKDSLLIMYEKTNNKDVIKNKSIYTYDSNKNKTKFEYYKKGGDKIRFTYEYKYDDYKNIIDEKKFYRKGKLKHHTTKQFDSNNQITQHIVYKANGKINRKYTYAYDAKGNITQMILYYGESPYSEQEYEYTY